MRFSFAGMDGRSPKLLAMAIIAVIVVIIFLEALEDVVINGQSFGGSPFSAVLNAIIFLARNVTSSIRSWGYVGIFFLMVLESSSLPVPSEVILPFAGYLVFQGVLNFWFTVFLATAAGVIGSLIDYWVGLKGVDFLAKRKFLGDILFSKSHMETAKSLFSRYDEAVIFTRMVPGFRTIVSFPAGAVKMPLRKFVVYTTVGCTAWNLVLVGAGFYLGSNWTEIAGVSRYAIMSTVVAILILIVLVLVRRRNRLKAVKFSKA